MVETPSMTVLTKNKHRPVCDKCTVSPIKESCRRVLRGDKGWYNDSKFCTTGMLEKTLTGVLNVHSEFPFGQCNDIFTVKQKKKKKKLLLFFIKVPLISFLIILEVKGFYETLTFSLSVVNNS